MNASDVKIENDERAPVAGKVLAGLFFFVLLAHALWFALSRFPDEFVDGDGYVRVLRVEMLWQSGNWFDNALPRNNAPYGDTSHWTRPLDVLISLLALPLIPFLGAKAAIFWGGALSGPVLHAGTAAALAWAAAPMVGRTAAVLAAVFVAAQASIWSYAIAMRADHHILFLFVVAAGFGFMVRALVRPGSGIRPALAAGALAAAGVWVGIEGLAYAGLCAVSFGVFWLAEDDPPRAPLGLAFGFAFAAGLIAALLIERGPGDALTVEYERLSVVHAALGVLVLMGFALLQGIGRLRPWQGKRERTLAGGACGALVLGAWYGLFPGIGRGPMVAYDPEMVALIFVATAEYLPGYTLDQFPVKLGAPVLSAPWLVWRLWRERGGRQRWAWVHLFLGVAFYGTITAAWGRWGIYAALFSCVALAEMVLHITNRIRDGEGSRPLREAGCALVTGGFLLGPLGVAYVAMNVFAPQERNVQLQNIKICSARPLAAVLARPPWSDRPRIIMTGANYAGELMYRTPHGVVASSYRMGYEGLSDTLAFFRSTNEKPARALLDRRKVDLIALCPAFGLEVAGKSLGAGTMYDRIIAGRAPIWIREVDLPAEASAFRLFEVLPDGRGR